MIHLKKMLTLIKQTPQGFSSITFEKDKFETPNLHNLSNFSDVHIGGIIEFRISPKFGRGIRCLFWEVLDKK